MPNRSCEQITSAPNSPSAFSFTPPSPAPVVSSLIDTFNRAVNSSQTSAHPAAAASQLVALSYESDWKELGDRANAADLAAPGAQTQSPDVQQQSAGNSSSVASSAATSASSPSLPRRPSMPALEDEFLARTPTIEDESAVDAGSSSEVRAELETGSQQQSGSIQPYRIRPPTASELQTITQSASASSSTSLGAVTSENNGDGQVVPQQSGPGPIMSIDTDRVQILRNYIQHGDGDHSLLEAIRRRHPSLYERACAQDVPPPPKPKHIPCSEIFIRPLRPRHPDEQAIWVCTKNPNIWIRQTKNND